LYNVIVSYGNLAIIITVVAKGYILQQKCLKKWIGSCPTVQILTLYTNP